MALGAGQILAKKAYRASLIARTVAQEIRRGQFREACEHSLTAAWMAVASCAPFLHRFSRRPNAEETLEFDRSFGVETSRPVRISEMELAEGSSAVQASYYQVSSPSMVRQALKELPVRHEEYTFIDCGSGKGIALLLASEFPFRRILGIEFAADLHRIALKNIGNFQNAAQRCHQIESVCADATTYEWPTEPLVFYLYNPFGEAVLQSFLERVEQSWRQTPRDIWFIYMEPLLADCFDRCAWLRLHSEVKSIPTRSYKIYRVLSANH